MGTVVIILNKYRPHQIAVLDNVSKDVELAISMHGFHRTIDPDHVFVVSEWHECNVKGCAECENSGESGHYSGRLVDLKRAVEVEKEAIDLSKEKEKLLKVIDECFMGPCPYCKATKVTRIGEEWVCNAVISDSGDRCGFRKPLDFFVNEKKGGSDVK